jgi:hypothetical protein
MKVSYYALRESDEDRATGLFRVRQSATAHHLEHVDRNGQWVRSNGLIDYLVGKDSGSEPVSPGEARRIASRLGATL